MNDLLKDQQLLTEIDGEFMQAVEDHHDSNEHVMNGCKQIAKY